METVLFIITIVSVAAAVFAWTSTRQVQRRERERSEARVAALTAAADTRAEGGWAQIDGEWQWTTDARRTDDAPSEIHPAPVAASAHFFGTVEREAPANNLLPLFAAAGLIVLLGGALTFLNTSDPSERATATGQVSHPQPLELVSLGHAREAKTLTISGTVRNPRTSVKLEGLTAVVSLLDRNGMLVSTKDVPLDYRALGPGEEAPFKVNVPNSGSIARYRVSFRAGTNVVPHVDRRGDTKLASALR